MAKSGKQQGRQDSPRIALAQIEELMASSPQRGDALRADGPGRIDRGEAREADPDPARAGARGGAARRDQRPGRQARPPARDGAPLPGQHAGGSEPRGDTDAGAGRQRLAGARLPAQPGRRRRAPSTRSLCSPMRTDASRWPRRRPTSAAISCIRLEMKAAAKDKIKAAAVRRPTPPTTPKRRRPSGRPLPTGWRSGSCVRLVLRRSWASWPPAPAVSSTRGRSTRCREASPTATSRWPTRRTTARPASSRPGCSATRARASCTTSTNEKPACQIAEIRPDHRFYFQNEDQARKLGYDFCAYCFGKKRSKR